MAAQARPPTWRDYARGLAVQFDRRFSESEELSVRKTKGHVRVAARSDHPTERKPSGPAGSVSADDPFAMSPEGQAGACDRSMTAKTSPTNALSGLGPAALDLVRFAQGRRFATILVDPPWQFTNKTGKVAPEHKRLSRYGTMRLDEIMALPVEQLAASTCHLYLWCPNAMLPEGLAVLKAWGFTYKSNIVWHKIRKDGGSDGRGVGFYFRNVTELILFGVRGKNARTLAPGRRQVNLLATRKREHSRKPDEQYEVIEACSPGPFLELFARGVRKGWSMWGNQANDDYRPTWKAYVHHSPMGR
jgi:N6-adenosine-specific RNA methylase IME4